MTDPTKPPAASPEQAPQARKADLRRWALERRGRNETEIATTSADIRENVEPLLSQLPTHRWIVLFDAMPGEVDLSLLTHSLSHHQFALTRTPAAGRVLSIHPASAPRERHRFGYTQPVADAPVIPDADVAAVLVPGLLFDARGGRLGFGAGFYDRFLARFGPQVPRIGISSHPLVDVVPVEEHDVRMTHVATSRDLHRV